MHAPDGLYCPICIAYRQHTFRTRSSADGRKVRFRVCSGCAAAIEFSPAESPGVCCRKCGDVRLQSYRVWHRLDGRTIRIRKCLHCGTKSLCSERQDSANC
jgi:hypothetical protein